MPTDGGELAAGSRALTKDLDRGKIQTDEANSFDARDWAVEMVISFLFFSFPLFPRHYD